MSRYFAHLRDLLWTLRYGNRPVSWPSYLRRLPAVLFMAYETYFALEAWVIVHAPYKGIAWLAVESVYVIWAIYLFPLFVLMMFCWEPGR